MKVIICTWRIREWELQILNWSSSVQPEIVPLFTISFQCLKKKIQKLAGLWLIMSGYMDLRRPRVYRRSNVGLVLPETVTFFPVSFFPTCPLLLFFLLLFFLPETVTFFPVTFFPVTFFPCIRLIRLGINSIYFYFNSKILTFNQIYLSFSISITMISSL